MLLRVGVLVLSLIVALNNAYPATDGSSVIDELQNNITSLWDEINTLKEEFQNHMQDTGSSHEPHHYDFGSHEHHDDHHHQLHNHHGDDSHEKHDPRHDDRSHEERDHRHDDSSHEQRDHRHGDHSHERHDHRVRVNQNSDEKVGDYRHGYNHDDRNDHHSREEDDDRNTDSRQDLDDRDDRDDQNDRDDRDGNTSSEELRSRNSAKGLGVISQPLSGSDRHPDIESHQYSRYSSGRNRDRYGAPQDQSNVQESTDDQKAVQIPQSDLQDHPEQSQKNIDEQPIQQNTLENDQHHHRGGYDHHGHHDSPDQHYSRDHHGQHDAHRNDLGHQQKDNAETDQSNLVKEEEKVSDAQTEEITPTPGPANQHDPTHHDHHGSHGSHGHHYDRQHNYHHFDRDMYEAECRLKPNAEEPQSNVTGFVSIIQRKSSSSPAPLYFHISIRGVPVSENTGRFNGFIIHENEITEGKCSTAGPHFNPEDKFHGPPYSLMRHAGDFGNIKINERGELRDNVIMDKMVSFEGKNSILGRSIVLHKFADDLGQGGTIQSLITGNAGPGLACCTIVGKNIPSKATPKPTLIK